MGAIAYISESSMLEYHRTMGNTSINFWRLSTRNFEKFDRGSLLFFIDGSKQHKTTREKGIIGYGRAVSIRAMAPARAWQQFETSNGYQTRSRFFEALQEANKEDTLPKRIQCIELENVVFFKDAIYLSEVDFNLPSRLESFIYLEKDNDDIVSRLLNKAQEVGIDTWYEFMNPASTEKSFKDDRFEQKIRSVLSDNAQTWNHTQRSMVNAINSPEVDGFRYRIKNDSVQIIIPCSSVQNQFYEIIGLTTWLKKELAFANPKFVILLKNKSPLDTSLESIDLTLAYM